MADGSRQDILRGTVVETIGDMCAWPGESNEQLAKFKISDTAGSKRATVSGVLLIIATQPGISPSRAVTRFTNPVPPGLTDPLSTVSGLTNKGGYILRKSNHLMPIQNKLSLKSL